MASLWEFPGGKIEAGESPEQALARELSEELGITAAIGAPVTHIRHNYRHGGAVDLQFFAVHEFTGEIDNQIYQQVRWVKFEDLTGYEFLAADRGLTLCGFARQGRINVYTGEQRVAPAPTAGASA